MQPENTFKTFRVKFKPDHIKVEKNSNWWQSFCLMFVEVVYFMPSRAWEIMRYPIGNMVIGVCATIVAAFFFVLSRFVLLLAGLLGYLSYEDGYDEGEKAESPISDKAD